MTVPSPSSAAPSVRDLVARVHHDRRSGVVEVAVGEGVRRLTMRDGELFLPADHPLAGAVAPLLPLWPPRPENAGGAAQVRGLMARIAFLVGSWEGDARFAEGDGGTAATVGPLPTRLLLMEWAAARPDEELLADLGGEGALVAAAEPGDEPAALAARLLDPHAAVLFSRLSRPALVGELLRQAGEARARVLTDLARLRAAGLVVGREAPVASEAPVGRTVAPDVLRRYAERVGRDLAARPLALDPDSHRSRLADLLARSGGATAYELLGVAADASAGEVHAAYERLARLSHPSHAARLAVAAGERPLWLLFEQATAAYLLLSQPDRRRRYDAEVAAPAVPRAPAEKRGDEARQLARSYYERAAALIDAEDFHFAIELLKQAVSSHPRPEYYVLLGRAQAKNPNWLRHAVDSYRRALDLGAEDPRIAVALGRLCEEMEQYAEAERHYRAAVARDPHDADARAGLARLTGGGERKPGALGGLFGRGRASAER
jgi:tetratricopeptide (TPR) repeat protein